MTQISTFPGALTADSRANPFGNVSQDQLEELTYFQRRYEEERQKRLRPDGLGQYANVATSEKLAKFWEDPWVIAGTTVNNPVPDGGSIKLLILGAGAAGILQAVQAIKAGMLANEICIVDVAGGFGGAWYWNRYPGIACDVQASCYMPMLEEMGHIPSKKYPPGEEFRRHYESIATKYGLQSRAMWQTWSQSATWNASTKHWEVELLQKPRGGPTKPVTIHAKYMVLAAGLQSIPKIPNLEGIDKFSGHIFHASRWQYDITGGSPTNQQLWKLTGKRVGLIGNAASGGQSIVELAKYASDVYMFQRTPARVHPKPNPMTDVNEWKTTIATKPGWQDERNRKMNALSTYAPDMPATDEIQDTHTHLITFCANFGTPRDITPELTPAWIQHLNLIELPLLKSVHKKVDEIIADPMLAQNLKAWFPVWCKRSLFSDDYLPTLNRPNVHVIDTDGKGIRKLTEKGVTAPNGHEYPLDVIILATGFQSPFGSPDAKVNMTITGIDGLTMSEKWNSGNMGTLHGVNSRGFPNLFWPGPLQSSISPANTYVLNGLGEHVAYLINESEKRGGSIQPTQEAEDAWGNRIASMMNGFAAARGCTPGMSNGEGSLEQMSSGKRAATAKLGMWGRGVDDYLDVLRAWREQGDLEGFQVD